MSPPRVLLLRLLGAVLMGTSAVMVARYDLPREYLWFILAAWGGYAIGKVDDEPWRLGAGGGGRRGRGGGGAGGVRGGRGMPGTTRRIR